MSRYYIGRQARSYNMRLRAFTERTLTEALPMIDTAALRRVSEREGRSPRMLDVACGTGVFLKRVLEQAPAIEACGIDGSVDMLMQARATLSGYPQVHLQQVVVGDGETSTLPFAPGTFDLITCTNALHAMPYQVRTLLELGQLLTAGGQLVLEDFARREPPFPWAPFEWLVRRVVGGPVHVYTLAEAKSLCLEAGLCIVGEKAFRIDWLLHGWALRASRGP
jgi:ubiquinone/menaquinone biosynthesis C-methylase UbiE